MFAEVWTYVAEEELCGTGSGFGSVDVGSFSPLINSKHQKQKGQRGREGKGKEGNGREQLYRKSQERGQVLLLPLCLQICDGRILLFRRWWHRRPRHLSDAHV